MLTISKPLNASQAQTYHASEFASSKQNYWKQDGATLGEWQGALARRFVLSGPVDAEHFARLIQGQHPVSAEQIVRVRPSQEYVNAAGETVKPAEHRAGWDATFSAPKSVSLTALVGGDDRVREAHREAVTTALQELERYTQARVGGNHPAEMTGRFIVAKFEHDAARPVDGYAAPQLHTHAVIFNMTERDDGTMRALQPRSLFESQQFVTAVYQAELMYRLKHLGYEIAPGKCGAPEIKGYSQGYLDASSPRRQQIEEALARSGFTGPEAAQIAAHNTREKKQIHSASEVVAAHRQIAAEYGNQAERVVAEARAKSQAMPREPSLDSAERAREAVSFSKSRNFEREAVVDERALLRDALRRGMGELTYREIRGHFDSRTASPEFRVAERQKYDSGIRYTIPEVIAAEHATIRQMRQGRDSLAPIMPAEAAREHAQNQTSLNTAQQRVVEEVLSSMDGVQGLQGYAGTGKTAALRAIREGAERQGYAVEGFAPTGRAARQLREVGIPADTLQGYLARCRANADPANRHLYMLDESSLASTRQMQAFLQKIAPDDRILLVGDIRQHQGVDAGKPFEQMQRAGMRTARLDEIIRQKNPELLKAVQLFASGEIAAGVESLNQQGRITEVAGRHERHKTIAREYARDPENTLIVSPDNKSRVEINEAVRRELRGKGVLSGPDHEVKVLVPRSDLTSADRTWSAHYQPGDVLYYSRGSQQLGIDPGSYATVRAVEPKANQLTVQDSSDRQITYDPKRLQGISAYEETRRSFCIGDRLQFTATNRELGVSNRDHGTVQAIEENLVHGRLLTVRLDGSARIICFDPTQMRHFDHGYAVTSHSSQGLTSDRVLVNVDTKCHPELIDSRFAYVSVSRGSGEVHIFTDDENVAKSRLSAGHSKSSAIEINSSENIPRFRPVTTDRHEATVGFAV